MSEYNMYVGLDLGDREHLAFAVDRDGESLGHEFVANVRQELKRYFLSLKPGALVAMEAGACSAWVSRIARACGHTVVVAHPRRLWAIFSHERKSDRRDAEMLARLARADLALLSPIEHRSERAQADLAVLKARDGLVRSRNRLVHQMRSTAKCFGVRLPGCSTRSFATRMKDEIPEVLRAALEPLVDVVQTITKHIREYDKKIEALCQKRYPETLALRQVMGVGPVTALTFVLMLEEPSRFDDSRNVPAYVGLVPRRDQSGEVDKQLRITKAGNPYLRRLLVGCAQYILGHFGPDSDLKRWGLALAERGGKAGRKRAVIGVARKLAVLLHRLWLTGEVYEPLRNASRASA